MSPGWIKKHRSADEHPCLQEFDAAGVWDRLLLRAAYRPRRELINGVWVTLERGQLAVSLSSLAEKGGIKRKRMRTIIGRFVANGMITVGQVKGHAASLVTICNYDLYQSSEDADEDREGQPRANEGPSSGQPRANEGPTSIKEEGKNDSVGAEAAPPIPGLEVHSTSSPGEKKTRTGKTSKRVSDLDELQLDEELLSIAREERRDAARELAKFRDNCRAKGITFKDYRAGFRNWLRSEYGRGPQVGPPPRSAQNGMSDWDRVKLRKLAEKKVRDEGGSPFTDEGMRRVTQLVQEMIRAGASAPTPQRPS